MSNSMSENDRIINCLEQSPFILQELIRKVPKAILKEHRRIGKWSIHENACHLAQAEDMILNRFRIFKKEDRPHFKPYLPDKIVETRELIDMNLQTELSRYELLRSELVNLVLTFRKKDWQKSASHPEYKVYNPIILLRHTLMHDHFHMYRIEELWLTKDEYL